MPRSDADRHDHVVEIDDLVSLVAGLPRQGPVTQGSARQVEALVALGILRRLASGEESRIVWMPEETESGAAGKLVALGELAHALHDSTLSIRTSADASQIEALIALGMLAGPEDPRQSEEFDLDRATDYEHERLLMYRVILAFEVVAAIVLVREITLGLL